METAHYLHLAEIWANLLDNQLQIGKLQIGLDAIFGLLPGGGDLVAALLSLYLIWIAYKLRLPTTKIVRMLGNILVDFAIGTIPIIGDVGYLFYKSNLLNLKILKEHISVHHSKGGDIVSTLQYADIYFSLENLPSGPA